MFRKIPIAIVCLIIFGGNGILFAGIRCGKDIISVGDVKSLVISKIQSCGKVLDKDSYVKEMEGSSDGESVTIQKKIDLWTVRIKERGNNYYCYPLTFEDSILTSIGSWSRCD